MDAPGLLLAGADGNRRSVERPGADGQRGGLVGWDDRDAGRNLRVEVRARDVAVGYPLREEPTVARRPIPQRGRPRRQGDRGRRPGGVAYEVGLEGGAAAVEQLHADVAVEIAGHHRLVAELEFGDCMTCCTGGAQE